MSKEPLCFTTEYSGRGLTGSNFDQAVSFVDQFHCKEVYVYAMRQESWLNHDMSPKFMSLKYSGQSRPIIKSNRLIEYSGQRNMVAERLFGREKIFLFIARAERRMKAAALSASSPGVPLETVSSNAAERW